MRLVTWNANMAFRNKQRILVERLNPDVAFIQECEHPDKFKEKSFPSAIWKGENQNKGIAVFSKYKIIELDKKIQSRFYIPFKVKDTFFIGIWAMNDEEKPQNRYIAQVWNILNEYQGLLSSDIVIFGDFNWNIIWDKKPDYPLAGDFRDVNIILNNYNIESVYHYHFNEDFGEEKRPTYFMARKKDESYHTDYIFSKKNTLRNLKEFFGQYDEWIKYSDHMPLLMER